MLLSSQKGKTKSNCCNYKLILTFEGQRTQMVSSYSVYVMCTDDKLPFNQIDNSLLVS